MPADLTLAARRARHRRLAFWRTGLWPLSHYLACKYYLFGLRVRWRARFRRYDLCQAMDAMSLFAARGFAARGVPVLLDINEIPDPFERQGRHFVAAPDVVKRHLTRAFARDMPAADAIIATSDSMADVVTERFGRPATTIRNARAPLAMPPSSTIRADLDVGPETRIMVYPCTAAPHLGVETAIELLTRLPDGYALVFVGRFQSAAYRETIERLIRRHGLEPRVLFKGELPDSAYLPYIAGADFGLVPLRFTYRNQRVVLPWRVVDLAAAGVPILATPSDEIRRIAGEYDIGEIADGDDADALAAALRRLETAPLSRRAVIRRDLAAMAERFAPPRQRALYQGAIGALTGAKAGRAAFICNLALRRNRRLIGFIDALCDWGWRVDLYSVRAPQRRLFRHPGRVRFVDLSDRLLPAGPEQAWRAARRLVARRPVSAWLAVINDAALGIWFGLRQLRRVLRFARVVRRAARRRGPWDIVIATDLFALAAGLAAGRRAMLVYDASEIPDLRQRTSFYLRRIPGPLRLPFRYWERRFVARAGLVLTPSRGLARYLRRRYRARGAPTVIALRNIAPSRRADIVAGRPEVSLRARLGLAPSDCVLVFPCGISAETGAVVAVRMLGFLPPDCVLVFIGRFANARAKTEIDTALRRHGNAHRCFFLGEVEHALYLRYLADGDIGLVLFDPAIANLSLSAPNRFFDLVAMEIPMVTTMIDEIAPVLRGAGTGIVVSERRPAIVARAVMTLRERVARDRAMPAKLARLARRYDAKREATRFLATLADAIGSLDGKRIVLLTLRNAFSNRRFLRHGTTLYAAGAAVDAFDTDIGAPDRPIARPPWLTTIALR